MQNNSKVEVLYAGFFARLSAYILDCIIIGALLLVVKIPKLIMYFINPDSIIFKSILFKFSVADILIYLLGLSYFVVMTYLYGATLGKKAFNLAVVKSNEDKLALVDVIYRESIGRYLSSILFLGYIIIMGDSKKRGFHDMLCDTIVIYNFDKKKVQYKRAQKEVIKSELKDHNLVDEQNAITEVDNNNEKIILEKTTEDNNKNEVSNDNIINEDNIPDKDDKESENTKKVEDKTEEKREN